MKPRPFTVAIAVSALAAAVFAAWNGTVIAKTPDLPIHGSGSWRSYVSGGGSWRADLALDGNTVSGILTVSGNNELGTSNVSGVVSGNSLTLDVTRSGRRIAAFSGSLNAAVLVGTYRTVAGDGGAWAGSWTADAPSADSPMSSARVVSLPPRETTNNTPVWLSGARLAMDDPSASQFGTSFISPDNLTIGSNVLVNNPNDAGSPQEEPTIAGDPSDANHLRLAAGAIDYTSQGNFYPGFYASTDGGSTWPVRGLIPGLSGVTYPKGGDPVLAFDQGGRVYYTGVGFNTGSCKGTSAVFVARSSNGGQSYDNAVLVASASDGTQVLHDKPWIATDRATGNVYVTWTRYTTSCGYGQIWEAVSTNHGTSFDAGRQVSTDPSYPVSTASNVAVGTDGVVNVVWLAGNRVMKLARCANGGTTCGADQTIMQITPLPSPLPGMQFRVNSFPMLAIDSVAANGYLTVVWADYRSGIGQIYSTISTDNGTTWTAPLAVAPASTDQFFPAISVDSTHLQRIVYYQRTSQSADTFNVFFVTGNGRGSFSTPTQVNDGGDISGYGFPGDYIGIASPYYNHPVWTDTRRGNHDIYTATVSGC